MRYVSWLARRALPLLLCGVGLGACNLLLGIEDIKASKAKDGGASDAAASSGKSSKADASVDAGRSSTGSRDAGNAGSMDAGKGGSMDAGKGSSMDAGVHADAAASDAAPSDGAAHMQGDGASGNPEQTVHGTVIDYFRHPLAAVTVTIGTTAVMTAADGTFTIADVPASYDVSLTLTTIRNNSPAHYGWLFQGLTRGDPMLQVYRGLPDRSGDLMISVTNAFPLSSTQKILMDFAGPDGEFDLSLDNAMTDYISAAWIGPASVQGTAHALLWNYAGAQDLPTTYLAHDAHPVALSDTSPGGSVTFDLSSSAPPTTGMVSGTVTNPAGSDRENQVFVRFSDGAVLLVAQDAAVQNDFSYAVPALANAGITVAAITGNSYPFAVAYQDNLAVGQTGISLSIPTPPSLTGPQQGASAVDGNTTFQWSGASQVFVLVAQAVDTYDAVFVVTTNKQAKIPASIFSVLPANASIQWSVETHGSYASVDDATSTDGLLDAFAYGKVRGPRRGAGSYTESEQRSFTTAP